MGGFMSRLGGLRLVLRFMAWVVAPVLLLCSLEVALRLAGYGTSRRPFVDQTVRGETCHVLNMPFFEQLTPFSPVGSNSPETVVPAKKAPGAFRIALLGGSASFGFLKPEYGVWRTLDVILRERYPDIPVETYCLGWNAMNSHVMRYVVERCAPLDIDLFVVYMGHNEFKGSLPDALYEISTEGRATRKAQQLLHRFAILYDLRIVQAAAQVLSLVLPEGEALQSWHVAVPVSTLDDPRIDAVHRAFRANLEAICASAHDMGAEVMLCSLGQNLTTFPPLMPRARMDLGPVLGETWRLGYETGKELQEQGDFKGALARFESVKPIDPNHADLLYRMGMCYVAIGQYARAKDCLVRVRDWDFSLTGANSTINRIVVEVASSRRGRLYFDAAAYLMERAPNGLPDSGFFRDRVHLTFEGNYVLATGIGENVGAILARKHQDAIACPSISVEECRERMAFSAWDQIEEIDEVFDALVEEEILVRDESLVRIRENALARTGGHSREEVTLQACRAALAHNTNDLYVRHRYALCLFAQGEEEEATRQAHWLMEHYPCHWRARDAFGRIRPGG